jgi:hypothetical protein
VDTTEGRNPCLSLPHAKTIRRVTFGQEDSQSNLRLLAFVKIPLIANAHPLQVNPGIAFLCTLEGFSFVSGLPFPVQPFVGSRPVLSNRARNGFDITADERNNLLVCHVVVNVPFGVFYLRREYDIAD